MSGPVVIWFDGVNVADHPFDVSHPPVPVEYILRDCGTKSGECLAGRGVCGHPIPEMNQIVSHLTARQPCHACAVNHGKPDNIDAVCERVMGFCDWFDHERGPDPYDPDNWTHYDPADDPHFHADLRTLVETTQRYLGTAGREACGECGGSGHARFNSGAEGGNLCGPCPACNGTGREACGHPIPEMNQIVSHLTARQLCHACALRAEREACAERVQRQREQDAVIAYNHECGDDDDVVCQGLNCGLLIAAAIRNREKGEDDG